MASVETFVNYWSGEEPTTTSPALDAMPPYVDVVPLAFVFVDANWQLTWDFLCKQNPAPVIQGWIEAVRAQGTKVLFSILNPQLSQVPDPQAFAQTVAEAAVEWGVDGVDLDYEGNEQYPFNPTETLVEVASELRTALRDALHREPYLSAPIFYPWQFYDSVLHDFAAQLDLVTTMDYTGWVGVPTMEQYFGRYAQAIGSTEKLAIGLSCMGPSDSSNFTPLDDVVTMAAWEPEGGRKGGAMLYTFSYDVTWRPVVPTPSGTGYPDCCWTKTIHENLP
ncbi:MAG TPA: glycosyl hydrolase family 18 protein [Solirubrobacteraceae bacterium]|nr:glycosyl hydrolase family 18 protein [Solirubrobacteraceae bacterium]